MQTLKFLKYQNDKTTDLNKENKRLIAVKDSNDCLGTLSDKKFYSTNENDKALN